MKNCGYPFIKLLVIQKYEYSFISFPQNGKFLKLTENSPKFLVLLFQISLIVLVKYFLKPAIHLSSNWREHDKMFAKWEKREVHQWHFVNRLANHFSHFVFRHSRQAISILTKRQRGRDDTRNIFVHHYTFIKTLYSFAYFPHQFFFNFQGRRSSQTFFFQSLKNVREILYKELLYVWTAAFDVCLVGIFSGKYSRQVEVCA